MEDHGHKAPGKCTKIRWGAIIAGAAIVAGAVLFAPGMPQAIGGAVQGIAEWIMGFTGKTVEVGSSHIAEKIVDALTSTTARMVGGAALMGGGAAYFMDGREESHPAHVERLAHENRETFVEAENMRLMQSKMIIQAAAAGNPQAQAMMAQMQGRGC